MKNSDKILFSISSAGEIFALRRMIYTIKFVLDEDEVGASEFAGSPIIAEMARRVVDVEWRLLVERPEKLKGSKERELKNFRDWLAAENHPKIFERWRNYVRNFPHVSQWPRAEQEQHLKDFLSPFQARPETIEDLLNSPEDSSVFESTRKRLTNVAEAQGIRLDQAQSGLNFLWPLVEAVRADGSVFVVKVDGERTRPEDGGVYTVFVTGARLGGRPCRADGSDVEETASQVLLQYAKLVWNIDTNSGKSDQE